MDLVYRRKGISYEEGHPVDWSKTRRYNPATKTQYTDAIIRLKESGLPTAQIAAEFGLHPELFQAIPERVRAGTARPAKHDKDR